MRTYKFLAKGALGPLSGVAWPAPKDNSAPGEWIEVSGPLTACSHGLHVCRTSDLAHWIHDELWEVEAEGDPIDGLDCLVVPRARLVRRIDAWSDGGGQRFSDACCEHAAAEARLSATDETNETNETVRALLDDARYMAASGYLALTAFTAAFAVSRASGEKNRENVYRRERAWQSTWIAGELLLQRNL